MPVNGVVGTRLGPVAKCYMAHALLNMQGQAKCEGLNNICHKTLLKSVEKLRTGLKTLVPRPYVKICSGRSAD
jgi:hypothetical protein